MSKVFNFCPKCGAKNITLNVNKVACGQCGFTFYLSTAAATSILIKHGDDICFLVRNREPKKGFLDLPGGFIEYGETAENGIIREVNEEIGLVLESEDIKYIGSEPNQYEYNGVNYHTCDIFFSAELNNDRVEVSDLDEISKVVWVNRNKIDYSLIAFESVREILKKNT